MEKEIENILKTLTVEQATVFYWTCRRYNRVWIGNKLHLSPQQVTDEMSHVYDKLRLLLGITKDVHHQTRRTILRKYKVCEIFMGLIEGNPNNLVRFPILEPIALEEIKEVPSGEVENDQSAQGASDGEEDDAAYFQRIKERVKQREIEIHSPRPDSHKETEEMKIANARLRQMEQEEREWKEASDTAQKQEEQEYREYLKHLEIEYQDDVEQKALDDEYYENYESYWGISYGRDYQNDDDYHLEIDKAYLIWWGENSENLNDLSYDYEDDDYETDSRTVMEKAWEALQRNPKYRVVDNHQDIVEDDENYPNDEFSFDTRESPDIIQDEVVTPSDHGQQQKKDGWDETEEQQPKSEDPFQWSETDSPIPETRWWETRRHRIATVIAIILLFICIGLAVSATGRISFP